MRTNSWFGMRARLGIAASVGMLIGGTASGAQTPAVRSPAADSLARADTTRVGRLEPVVVIAQRTEAPLAASAAAVTRLSPEALRALPARSVAEALQFVPGIAVLPTDGVGDAPRLAVRGFYGGGETEYVTVLLDGVPLTGLAAGTVNWDLVPMAPVQAIEVVRGGASALYGDAAVGGVVNLITRRDDDSYARWRVAAGELGLVRGGGAVGGLVGGRRASLFGDLRRSTGYRTHERRDVGTVGGSIALAGGAGRTLNLSLLGHRRDFDEPGPVAGAAALAQSRRASSPLFRFDNTDERLGRVALDGSAVLGARTSVKGFLAGEGVRADAVRTIPLSADPEFADTKAREARTTRLLGSVQTERAGLFSERSDRLVLGTDFVVGVIRSQYEQVMMGGSGDYAAAPARPARELDARGRGRRVAAAGFANWEAVPAEALRLTLGGRLDWIEDRYTPRAPSEGDRHRNTHVAFSPRAGANLRYLGAERQSGHLYVTGGRSFKAPTIDQLFDQRSTPTPFGEITTSNPLLQPQYGTSVEAGLYHNVALVPDRLAARLALSAYQMDMKDELDFSFESFRYVNLGKSRHRGVEAGLALSGPAATSAFANYTQQDATSRFGDNRGKFLKTIPRRVLAAGVGVAPRNGLAASVAATSVRDAFLDDANERKLQNFTRVDVRTSYPILGVRLSLDVRNAFNEAYSANDFQDPAGSDLVYYYPAARRVVIVGLESGW
jgi:outer membrane receptor protein involved in Fe transport